MSALALLVLGAAAAAPNSADMTVFIDLEEGKLKVQESWMLRLDEPIPPGQLTIPLPDGVTAVRQPQEQQGFAFDQTAGRVFNETQLSAGRSHVFFNYDLPYGSSNVSLRWKRSDIDVPGLRLAVPKLERLSVQTPVPPIRKTVREVGGVPFELIDIPSPFQTGATFTANLRGLPVRMLWPRWLAVALCVGLVGLTLYLVFTARGRSNVDRPELLARKERLMQALKILEQDRSSMEAAAYGRRRNELLGELADVLRQEAR